MNTWTINKRIIFAFALMLLLPVILAGTSMYLLYRLDSSIVKISQEALPGVVFAAHLSDFSSAREKALLLHLQAATPDEMQSLEKQIKQIHSKNDALVEKYQKDVPQGPEGVRVVAMETSRDSYRSAADGVLDLSRQNRKAEALDAYRLEVAPLARGLGEQIDAYFASSEEDARNAAAAARILARAGFRILIGVGAASLVLGIALAVTIARSLNRDLTTVAELLESGSQEIASAAGQVSSSSQSLAEGASEQAASLEQTSAALEEIGSMTKRNAESAQAAQGISAHTRAAAETGTVRMEEMQGAMEAIRAASDEMGTAIEGIKASSDNVSKIIRTIDEIAFQTNILALNAAVEAARAGEAGAGFAVVADEVRSLAQRSATAAKETAQMIEAAVRQSALGVTVNSKVTLRIGEIVNKSDAVRKSLDQIVGKVREVDALISTIATASKEQSVGLEQINSAITQVDHLTQTNAAGSEESASAAEELNAQSNELHATVLRLLRLVEGDDEEHVAASFRASDRSNPVLTSAKKHLSQNSHSATPVDAQAQRISLDAPRKETAKETGDGFLDM